jgi:hypothetical protein
MSRIVFFFIGSSFLVGGFVPTTVLASQAPVRKSPQVKNLPACYVQTKDGKIIDLTASCGFVRPAGCNSSLGSASRDAVLTDFCNQNKRCLLTNTCQETPRGINTPPPGTPVGKILSNEAIA